MLKQKIEQIFRVHKERYGVPRIYNELRKQGVSCSYNRVERLMRQMDLREDLFRYPKTGAFKL